jgi:hypothetical protein
MTDNINSVLTYLKDLSLSKTFKLIVPSTQNEITIRQLTTEQLKQILETITDTSSLVNDFNKIFFSIVKENITEDSSININNFTIYDLHYIALQMRINSLSENYMVYFTDEEIETYELPIREYGINLKEVLKLKTISLPPEKTITDNEINVVCGPTTIQNELDFIEFFNTKIKTLTNKDMQKIIGEIFLYEIAKGIKSVNINQTLIDFSSISFIERIKIIKELPTIITSQIIKYIETYKQALYDMYLVQIETSIENQTIIFQKELQYNATLFNY